jgi:hypothetical protein
LTPATPITFISLPHIRPISFTSYFLVTDHAKHLKNKKKKKKKKKERKKEEEEEDEKNYFQV